MECPNCGYMMSKRDKKCPYCGTENAEYSPIKNVINDTFTPVSTALNTPRKNNATPINNYNTQTKSNINWLLAIILLIVFWPVGLLYIVLKLIGK